MVKRTPTLVSILVLSVLLNACEGPNCFAGECVAGVPEPEEATQEYKDYFFEIALPAGLTEVPRLLRFEEDVTFRLHGSPTRADSAEVERIIEELRELTGRQISMVSQEAAFDVHFVPRADFEDIVGPVPEHFEGYIRIFFRESGAIDEATALIATDGPTGADRHYIMRQLITRGFGLIQVSDLHPTSIFYTGFNGVTSYALIDKFVISTAYDPRLQAGMTRADVTAALEW